MASARKGHVLLFYRVPLVQPLSPKMMSIQKRGSDGRRASRVIHRYQNLPSMWSLIEAKQRPNPNERNWKAPRRSRNSRLLTCDVHCEANSDDRSAPPPPPLPLG